MGAAVKTLLSLKADYKTATGQDWKPGCVPPVAPAAPQGGADAGDLDQQITDQGLKVRQLKSDKAAKVITFCYLCRFHTQMFASNFLPISSLATHTYYK